ncbi:GntR family transcriptional regulator [Mucilaginibacter sp.]|uniref:FadR/GntR family transcriptional regulator n=1 Tax=Mucilaginibacter sp. TaxID=1882438 RepID=UPI0028425447|nr:GntR family transcriptional regulator [Mucilaginibacter sp.]MDR3697114.1 GntR family transcriptional regulator [Mucilaginibacter sp.]
MNPVHISHRSLADEVASLLQDNILKGEYKVNQKLPVEAKLMEIYGVGRSTVREAVKTLVNSGFLRVEQGKGTFIEDNTGMNEPLNQRLKRASPQDIMDVRQMLEIKIAEKAASNRTGNDISKLEHFLNKRAKAADQNLPEECIEAHINFFQVLADASKNDLLSGFYKQFLLQLKTEMLENMKDTSFFKEKRDYYQNLLDGVLRQDAKKAAFWSGKINGTII